MGAKKRIKTRRRTRDYDQVRADLTSPKHLSQFQSTEAVEDLPGLGQFYCIECAKWFEGNYNLISHRKGKNHKRRVRILNEECHTQQTADEAVGLGVDNGNRPSNAMDIVKEKPSDQANHSSAGPRLGS